jgi:hypothetical protein
VRLHYSSEASPPQSGYGRVTYSEFVMDFRVSEARFGVHCLRNVAAYPRVGFRSFHGAFIGGILLRINGLQLSA